MEDRNKLNILFIIDSLNDLGGGTERHLFSVATLLDRRSFNPYVCCMEGSPEVLGMLESRGVRTVHIPVGKVVGLNALLHGLRLARFIRQNSVDVVQTFHFKSDTFGVLVSRLAGVGRIISSRRDTGELKTWLQVLFCRITNRFVDTFIAVCRAVADSLTSREGVAAGKIRTIYNGVDAARFSPRDAQENESLRERLAISGNAFVVGTVAWFRPEKDYYTFFKGMKLLREAVASLKVVIVGDGPMRKEMEAYCLKNKLGDAVVFAGYVKDVQEYLSLMDVFCLVPVVNEGFSNAILEAMASGKPVVATSVGGNPEAVVDGETGLLVPPGDPAAFCEALMRLHADRPGMARMGERARARAVEHFSAKGMIHKMEDLYLRPTARQGDIPLRAVNEL